MRVRKVAAIGVLGIGAVVAAGSITLLALMSSIGSSVGRSLSGLDQRVSRLECVDAVAVRPVAGYHQSVTVSRLATHAFYIDVITRGPVGRAWGSYDLRFQKRGTTVLGARAPSCWRLSGAHHGHGLSLPRH